MDQTYPTAADPIIELRDIEVRFRARNSGLFKPKYVHAVQGLSLAVNPGETIGIVGESGCGKSTTANVMWAASPNRGASILPRAGSVQAFCRGPPPDWPRGIRYFPGPVHRTECAHERA